MSSALMLAVQTAITHNESNPIPSETETYFLNELPPINLPNLSNYSKYSIQCENRFAYEAKESVCYPPCGWDTSETGMPLIINAVYLIISSYCVNQLDSG